MYQQYNYLLSGSLNSWNWAFTKEDYYRIQELIMKHKSFTYDHSERETASETRFDQHWTYHPQISITCDLVWLLLQYTWYQLHICLVVYPFLVFCIIYICFSGLALSMISCYGILHLHFMVANLQRSNIQYHIKLINFHDNRYHSQTSSLWCSNTSFHTSSAYLFRWCWNTSSKHIHFHDTQIWFHTHYSIIIFHDCHWPIPSPTNSSHYFPWLTHPYQTTSS